tara:strand:- start:689 stop:826 length:138 start_codon:yes stop_codon:yes gene_type:complete
MNPKYTLIKNLPKIKPRNIIINNKLNIKLNKITKKQVTLKKILKM